MFAILDQKIDHLASRLSKSKQLKNVPLPIAQQFAKIIVQGLLNQLQSMPAEMISIGMCYDQCPSLRDMQETALRYTIRDATASLAPRIRERTPKDIFDKNASMNAAFVLYWSEHSRDRTAVIPFESLGFTTKGQELLDAFKTVPESMSDRYQRCVDAWARILEIQTWYEWRFKNAENYGTDSI